MWIVKNSSPIFVAYEEEHQATMLKSNICAMVKSRYIWDGHPTFTRNLGILIMGI